MAEVAGVPPEKWGPILWAYLKTTLQTCSQEQAKTSLVPLIHAFHAMLPCASCRASFTKVLEKYPPEKADFTTLAGRMHWFDQVREEVRAHEAPKTAASRLRKYGGEILTSVGFILLLLVAAFLGALIYRRCRIQAAA